MKILRVCAITLLAVGLAPANAFSYEVVEEAILRSIGEPAGQHNPPCANGQPTTAKMVFGALSAATDAYIGAPVTATINELWPEKDNWKAARLGIHDGKSACQTLCMVVPNDASVRACMRDNGGKSCTTKSRGPKEDWGIGWMTIVDVTKATAGPYNVLFCATGKNWSDNRQRAFSIEVE